MVRDDWDAVSAKEIGGYPAAWDDVWGLRRRGVLAMSQEYPEETETDEKHATCGA